MKKVQPLPLVAASALLALASCSTTRLTSVWMDSEYRGGPVHSVMVVGVSPDRETRQAFEERFVKRFEQNGVRAVAAIDVFPPDREVTPELIEKEARSRGIETILVTHLVGIEEKPVYHPPMAYAPAHPYYDRFPGYYRSVRGYAFRPGYYTVHTNVKLESNLYGVKSGELIWSASSTTFNPDSARDLARSLSGEVIADMKRNGLIAPPAI